MPLIHITAACAAIAGAAIALYAPLIAALLLTLGQIGEQEAGALSAVGIGGGIMVFLMSLWAIQADDEE